MREPTVNTVPAMFRNWSMKSNICRKIPSSNTVLKCEPTNFEHHKKDLPLYG